MEAADRLPPTPTPAELKLEQGAGGWEWVYRVNPPPTFGEDIAFVETFKEIEGAFEGFKARTPHAVWNSRSGEWRGG